MYPFSYLLSTSTVVQTIVIPGVKTIQSITFGGKDLDILFVTTVSVPFDANTGQFISGATVPETAGLLFKITGLCVKGRPAKKLPKKFASFVPEISAQC